MRIFTNLEFNAEQRERLATRAAGHQVYFGDPEQFTEKDRNAFVSSDIAFGSCPPECLNLAGQLRWFQLDSVGYGEYQSLDWEVLAQTLTVTNLRGFFSVPVAETAIAGVLALYRGIDRLVYLKPKKSWRPLDMRSQLHTLEGSKALLVGYGAIGRAIGERLSAFRCSVQTFDRKAQGADFSTLAELDKRLPDVHIVFLSLPHTPDTIDMFDRRRLGLLKQDAMVVNVGRPSVLDESALAGALAAGRIMGAVIDVTAREPLPPDDEFWQTPNLMLTQHTAGGSGEEIQGKIDLFLTNLQRHERGDALQNVVNMRADC
jgi:glyoxylate/hydroxypyruvate reductase A